MYVMINRRPDIAFSLLLKNNEGDRKCYVPQDSCDVLRAQEGFNKLREAN